MRSVGLSPHTARSYVRSLSRKFLSALPISFGQPGRIPHGILVWCRALAATISIRQEPPALLCSGNGCIVWGLAGYGWDGMVDRQALVLAGKGFDERLESGLKAHQRTFGLELQGWVLSLQVLNTGIRSGVCVLWSTGIMVRREVLNQRTAGYPNRSTIGVIGSHRSIRILPFVLVSHAWVLLSSRHSTANEAA